MQDLLSLGVGEPVFPTEIVAVCSANKQVLENGKEFKPPIQVYYALPWQPKPPRNISSQQMVFTLKTIRERPDYYMNNWFSKAKELKPVLDIYFSLLYRENIYSEFRFLGLTQAIETYHRWRHDGKYQSDDEYLAGLYAQFLKSLPIDLDEDFRQSLEESALRYANEYSLRKRLKDLSKHFNKDIPFRFLTITKERKKFIEYVCNTRNYLTHSIPSPKSGE